MALLTTEDDWTSSVSMGFRKALVSSSTQLVFDQQLSPEDLDFRSIVLKLKVSNPDSIFVNLGLHQIGPAIRQLRQMGIQARIFSNFWMSKPEVAEVAGVNSMEGAMYAQPNVDLPNFTLKFKERFNDIPTAASLSAYLGTMLLGQAAKLSDGEKDYSSTLLSVTFIQTTNGTFQVKDRVVQFPMKMKVVKDGKTIDLPA